MVLKRFFKKTQQNIKFLFPNHNLKIDKKFEDIRPLDLARNMDLSFLDSSKYIKEAKETKALYCITTKKLEKFLPSKTQKIIVENVLYELARVLKKLYPSADVDYPDLTLKNL